MTMKKYKVFNLETGKILEIESDSIENAVYTCLIDVLKLGWEGFKETYTERCFYLSNGDITLGGLI
jgi:hypothetical protein